jgi:hypothetical protein
MMQVATKQKIVSRSRWLEAATVPSIRHKASKEEKIQAVRALFGILPADVDLDSARAERLAK